MRKIVVTSALPYANGPLHLGHILEAVQTDIWCRFQRMRGNACWYFCADDAHGTPIMLKAAEHDIEPEKFIQPIQKQHQSDFDRFSIQFANYHSTHSQENQKIANEIFQTLQENGDISKKNIIQAFDKDKKMFLPDRYVKGTCPKCQAPDQYGDSCENCGATYSPMDLQNPISTLSSTTPITKKSEHLFFQLSNYQQFLQDWLESCNLQDETKNKLLEWFTLGLNDWDISRDEPYFGFNIPGHTNKYFYVWLDAPIGYLASMYHYSKQDKNFNYSEIWKLNSQYEVHHFIGKDIIYFHALFWPAILHAAGLRTPSSVFAHGFLTINGAKMSKSRGNFITARQYLELLDSEHLRYYFAAKLSNKVDDINFNFEDYTHKINSELVGKFVNIASRCSKFIETYFNKELANKIHDQELFDSVCSKSEQIALHFENKEYARAIRIIGECADLTNQYIDKHQPWKLIKTTEKDMVQNICTMGLNLFRIIAIYLKPVIPNIIAEAEKFLNIAELSWQDIHKPLLSKHINTFHPLSQRVNINNLKKLQENNMTNDITTPDNNHITIDEFSKVELRIAKIVTASHIEGADALLKLELDVGETKNRQVFAGIKKAYNPEDIQGRLTIFVANLKPRKMRFGISEGMVLMASGDDGIFMLSPDSGAKPGMRVK